MRFTIIDNSDSFRNLIVLYEYYQYTLQPFTSNVVQE